MNFAEQQFFIKNKTQTLLIFVSMTFLLTLLGYIFAEIPGVIYSLFLVVFAFIFTPRISPSLLLKMYNAQRIEPQVAPELVAMVEMLSDKAKLASIPEIYYLPSSVVNSFTLGDKENCKILLSGGLLMSLNARELYSVLAHEISHVQNNDLNVMALADVISRVTSVMSMTGIFLLIFTMPFMITGDNVFPLSGLLLLTFAPNIMTLLQLALSRNREFVADQQAVKLTGDAEGLASALAKIDSYERHWARQFLIPNYKLSEPSLLRTHPPSKERIKRLLDLAKANHTHKYFEQTLLPEEYMANKQTKKPRRRFHGLWY